MAVTPSAVSPDGDGIDDTATFTFTLVTSGDVTITVVGPDGAVIAAVFAGPLGPGDYSFGWNGTGVDGLPAVPGSYQVVVSVVDLFGTVTQPGAFAVAAPSV